MDPSAAPARGREYAAYGRDDSESESLRDHVCDVRRGAWRARTRAVVAVRDAAAVSKPDSRNAVAAGRNTIK